MVDLLPETSNKTKIRMFCFALERNKLVTLITTIVAAIVFAIALVISTFNGIGIDIGLFNNSAGNLSRKYQLPITPVSGTFMIWQFIYLWLILLFVYALVCLCRSGANGRSVSAVALIFLTLANITEFTWLFVWDNEALWGAFVDLFLYFVFIWLAAVAALVYFKRTKKERSDFDWWMTTILVNNGIAFNAAWVSLAMALNFSIALAYSGGGTTTTTASIVGLVIWTIELLTFFSLDMFMSFKNKVTDFFFSPYIVFIVGLQGAYRQEIDWSGGISVFLLILLVQAIISFIVKLATMIYFMRVRHSKKLSCSCAAPLISVPSV